jgi:hypothetical protein
VAYDERAIVIAGLSHVSRCSPYGAGSVERTSRIIFLVACAAVILPLLLQALPAHAQTDEIQVYDASIAATGALNLTLHDNYTPSGSKTPAFPGGIATDGSLNGAAEWAYGVANWFEAGLYLPLYSITRNNGVVYNGMKLRALFVTPDADRRKFFCGVNFEFSLNTAHWDERTYTSEIRPIVGAHLGRFDFIFNPIVDSSWNGFSKLQFVPATRVALAISEKYKIALEEYDEFGPVSHFLPAAKQSHQLFGVLDINTKWIGIEAGIGAALTNASDHWVLKLILSKDL